MIPESTRLDQPTIALLQQEDTLVQRYRELFALLDWTLVENWQEQHDAHRSGPHAHPESAYLKAFLIKLVEELPYITQLRRFLLEHPLLVLDLGFHLHLDPQALYGFDVQASLPCERWLREKLRRLDVSLLHDLFAATVHDLQEEIPGLGEVIAVDVKHIYAWVKENNPRVSMLDRFCKERQPKGDPDCRVGVKRSSNQVQADGSTKEKKEYLWGYGSGVVAALTADYGAVVLAEYTLTFNHVDQDYYFPLYWQCAHLLGRFPTHVAADAAFDWWRVYESRAVHGGIAAVPLREVTKTTFEADGDDEEELVNGLDLLWQRGIVREQDSTSYAFSYEQLRKAVYSTLSSVQRRLLHRRVAEALETVYAHDLDAISEQIATHYELAGLSNMARLYARRLTRGQSFAC